VTPRNEREEDKTKRDEEDVKFPKHLTQNFFFWNFEEKKVFEIHNFNRIFGLIFFKKFTA